MDWCSVYLTRQGLPKYIYLSPPLICPTTYNGLRTQTSRYESLRTLLPYVEWDRFVTLAGSKSELRVTLSYLFVHVLLEQPSLDFIQHWFLKTYFVSVNKGSKFVLIIAHFKLSYHTNILMRGVNIEHFTITARWKKSIKHLTFKSVWYFLIWTDLYYTSRKFYNYLHSKTNIINKVFPMAD